MVIGIYTERMQNLHQSCTEQSTRRIKTQSKMHPAVISSLLVVVLGMTSAYPRPDERDPSAGAATPNQRFLFLPNIINAAKGAVNGFLNPYGGGYGGSNFGGSNFGGSNFGGSNYGGGFGGGNYGGSGFDGLPGFGGFPSLGGLLGLGGRPGLGFGGLGGLFGR